MTPYMENTPRTPATPPVMSARELGGMGCCLFRMVTLVIMLVALVVLSLGVLAGHPLLQKQVTDQVRHSVQQGLSNISIKPSTRPVVVTEAQVNDYLKQHAADMQPLSGMRVTFTPGQIDVHASLMGQPIEAKMSGVAKNGQITFTKVDVQGPSGWLVDSTQLSQGIESAVAAALRKDNVKVQTFSIQEGKVVLQLAAAK